MGEEQRMAATPGLALRQHRLSLLFTSWPWRSLAYLLTTPLVALAWLLTCWPLLPLAGLPLGRVERWRLRWTDLHPIPDPHTSTPSSGFRLWARHRLGERITWTELLYGVVLIPLSLVGFAVMTIALLLPAALAGASGLLITLLVLGIDPGTVDPTSEAIHENPIAQVGVFLLGLLLLAAGMYLVTLAAEGQRYLTRTLISEHGAELAEQVHDLTRSRARITTAFDDERRRIERDLHDGAQQRLTALVMTLGAMRYQHDRGSDITQLIEQARVDAQQAVTELRDIVHGIYPAALRDHDLADALDELVARTDTHGLAASAFIDLPADLLTEVEVGLYFAASELFTNVTKHANATMVTLLAHHTPDGTVFLTVEDDGSGGALPDGTGLLGVIDRIETLGGRVKISSPAGGPTRITLEVPCASS
ncbi:sensor domain-containing protein [Streptosporangium sp. NPDC049046]|uniref:sensor histidine kinase n=1 Tax=Streptosporangium sp. NPDC049046 TaxID=3155031 RepID=UPI0034203436